jgi:hypothetical protein
VVSVEVCEASVAKYNRDKTMTVYRGIVIIQLQNRIEIKKNRDKIGCLENKIWTFMNVCYAPAPVGFQPHLVLPLVKPGP